MSKSDLIARNNDKTPASRRLDAHREEEDAAVSDFAPEADGRDEPGKGESRPVRAPKMGRAGGTGLRIYKPSQGYYTRMGTVIGAGILIIAGAYFLYDDVGGQIDPEKSYALYLRYGLSVGWILGMGVLLYWIVGLNRKTNDFFIATEGEMKKVSWSSRKEVIRSTKVVIVTVVLMAILLFVVDVGFMQFFRAIGVLKGGPGFLEIFSGNAS